jgi:two-component system response regulator FixJ
MRTTPRVLVVDDDRVMRAVLHRVFLGAGFRVETFDSARALLNSADLRQPAVLLLDVKMPAVSGLELQGMLNTRGIELPVMFLTGTSDIPIAVAAMRAGAVDFLEKPFVAAELVRRVESAFGRCSGGAMLPHVPADDYAQRLQSLTPREREIHDHMVTGMTSKVIAIELGGSFRTVEIHRTRVMAKMAAAHLADLVRMSYEAKGPTTRPRPSLRA